MPAWLPFADYCRLKRMESGDVVVLAGVGGHATRLRPLLAQWRPHYRWSVKVTANHRDLVVRKLHRWPQYDDIIAAIKNKQAPPHNK